MSNTGLNENIMNVEFMCELLAAYSKELYEAETYSEKGDVQLKHAKLILDKVKNCSITDDVKSACTCIVFHKSDECYKLGCKAHRSNEVKTVL